MNAWLFDDTFTRNRFLLCIEGIQGEWGGGDSVAEEEELPSPPQNVQAKPGNGRITITWDPVPDAMYYNLYFQTTKGVMIKFSELTRPIAGQKTSKCHRCEKRQGNLPGRCSRVRLSMTIWPTAPATTMS